MIATLFATGLLLASACLPPRFEAWRWALLAVAFGVLAVDSCGCAVGFRLRTAALPS